ncbi:putative calcium-binding protein CML25 [Sesamum angolense]|uniref:Calcium-binding protein CML25 n=1 Tax=Sesamum angolense TaxID=2727404 RepID=A0AAE1XDZ6_9LAMI|nr:putative calcium-binding protein CML25 [Sesamum angolense]
MGFKELFNRKKKQRVALEVGSDSHDSPPVINSRSPSFNSRLQMEEELEQVFKKFDVNGDGKISALELGSIMGSLGHSATEEELRTMIQGVDSDGDGFIDLQEFIELNTKDVDYDEVLQNLKDAFQVFDIDKNGSISAEELQDVLQNLGEECTLAECRKMISGVDTDGNGAISFDEFKVMMMMGSRFDAMEPTTKLLLDYFSINYLRL